MVERIKCSFRTIRAMLNLLPRSTQSDSRPSTRLLNFTRKYLRYILIIAKNVWRVHSSNSPWEYVLKHRLFCLFKTNQKDKQTLKALKRLSLMAVCSEIFNDNLSVFKKHTSLGFGRGSRVEGIKSRVEGNMSRVEGAKSRVLRK